MAQRRASYIVFPTIWFIIGTEAAILIWGSILIPIMNALAPDFADDGYALGVSYDTWVFLAYTVVVIFTLASWGVAIWWSLQRAKAVDKLTMFH